jgi:hypothetical protein
MWNSSTETEPKPSKTNFKWILAFVLLLLIGYKFYSRFENRFSPKQDPKIVRSTPKKNKLQLVPAGSLLDDHATYTFAVYHVSEPLKEPQKLLKELIAGQFNKFGVIEKPDEKVQQTALIFFDTPDIKDFAPPDLESLEYFGRGLNKDEQKKLQGSKSVSVLNFRSPMKENAQRLREAYELMEVFAKETGGYLWDETTRECFTLDEWRIRREKGWQDNIPDIPRHVIIHFYYTDEYYRQITLGMEKFGLPDVVVNDIPKYFSNSIKDLINLTCQTIIERPKIEKSGLLKVSIADLQNQRMRKSMQESLEKDAKGFADLAIRIGEPEEGDPDNRLLEIYFPAETKLSTQAQQAFLISTVFGGEDNVSDVEHDQEILVASQKAKAKLPELQKLFNAGLPPGEHILLKAPFRRSDEGNEWMWVEVVSWKIDKVEGILVNKPVYVPSLNEGDRVSFHQEVVFDYIHEFADGSSEGNETGKIFEAREKKQPSR